MNKVAICVVYFGQFPKNFDIFLSSCISNRGSTDFLFFTDNGFVSCSPNIVVNYLDVNGFKELARMKLHLPNISFERMYKKCDYKITYGMLFEKYLLNYDYWGYCDLDMVFGDLGYFFEKYNLFSYEKFLPLGHLSLYRNKKDVNERFITRSCDMTTGDYIDIFTHDKNYCADELPGIYQIYKKNNFPMFDKRIFADIGTIHKRFVKAKMTKQMKDKNYKRQLFYYENGKVFFAFYSKKRIRIEEEIYIHFKNRDMPIMFSDRPILSSFFITYDGFKKKDSNKPVTLADINLNNPYKGFCVESFEIVKHYWFHFLNKLNRRLL